MITQLDYTAAMTRRTSKRQRDVGLVKDYVVRPVGSKFFFNFGDFFQRAKTYSKDGEEPLVSLRTFVYSEDLPTAIVMTKVG